MARVLNISNGPRGVHHAGLLITVEAGGTTEADDWNEEWFKEIGDGDEAAPELADLDLPALIQVAAAEGVIPSIDQLREGLVTAIEAKRAGADDLSPFDHDGDGEPGGSTPQNPPALSGKNKAELLEIAAAEDVEIADGATNAEIVTAIEAKRAAT